MPRRRLPALLLVLLGLLLTACGGGGEDGVVEWRDLDVTLPDGWIVNEEGPSVLGLANRAQAEPGVRGEQDVYVQMTHEPGTIPDDWRRFVEEQDGTLEEDLSFDVGGAPATRLVFSFTTNGVMTKEMIVLVPAREIVMLFQPVVAQGETDGPARFDAFRATFEEILDSITFGAPIR